MSKVTQQPVKVNYIKQDKSKNWQGAKVQNFEIEGLDELIKAFSALGADALYKLSEPSVEAAQIVCNRAKAKINDDTGNLKNNIIVKKPGRSRNKQKYQIFAKVTLKGSRYGSGGQYGVPLELGHRLYFFGKKTNTEVKERPFLRPAADESKDEVANIMAAGMNKVLDEWGD